MRVGPIARPGSCAGDGRTTWRSISLEQARVGARAIHGDIASGANPWARSPPCGVAGRADQRGRPSWRATRWLPVGRSWHRPPRPRLTSHGSTGTRHRDGTWVANHTTSPSRRLDVRRMPVIGQPASSGTRSSSARSSAARRSQSDRYQSRRAAAASAIIRVAATAARALPANRRASRGSASSRCSAACSAAPSATINPVSPSLIDPA